jgi:hypothetical protein
MDRAKKEFPILSKHDIAFKDNTLVKGPGFLEFWPSDETGTPESPRPKEFPMGKPGVEIRDPKTRTLDILGDVTSHYLIHKDPVVKQHYKEFEASMTPDQRSIMQEQYRYAKQNFGETRPYNVWYEHAGLPAYFRGYAFDQWQNAEKMYTPEQLKKLDELIKYLKSKPKE